MKTFVEFVWGDRWRWVKGALAAVALTGLSWHASIHLPDRYPTIPMIRGSPERHQGRRVWTSPRPITRAGEGEFEITRDSVPIRVVAPGPWMEGEWVLLRGTVESDHIVAEVVRRLPHYHAKRLAMYGASAALVLAVLVLFLRVARPSLEKGLFASRY